jgi:hypothetical protein
VKDNDTKELYIKNTIIDDNYKATVEFSRPLKPTNPKRKEIRPGSMRCA